MVDHVDKIKIKKEVPVCLFNIHLGSKITNLRSICHPERRAFDVAKIGFKTGAGKT
jgi:hypothetical protein